MKSTRFALLTTLLLSLVFSQTLPAQTSYFLNEGPYVWLINSNKRSAVLWNFDANNAEAEFTLDESHSPKYFQKLNNDKLVSISTTSESQKYTFHYQVINKNGQVENAMEFKLNGMYLKAPNYSGVFRYTPGNMAVYVRPDGKAMAAVTYKGLFRYEIGKSIKKTDGDKDYRHAAIKCWNGPKGEMYLHGNICGTYRSNWVSLLDVVDDDYPRKKGSFTFGYKDNFKGFALCDDPSLILLGVYDKDKSVTNFTLNAVSNLKEQKREEWKPFHGNPESFIFFEKEETIWLLSNSKLIGYDLKSGRTLFSQSFPGSNMLLRKGDIVLIGNSSGLTKLDKDQIMQEAKQAELMMAQIEKEEQELIPEEKKTVATKEQLSAAENNFNKAREYFGKQDYANAITYYEAVIKDQPDHFYSYMFLTYSLLMEKKVERATVSAQRAYETQLFDQWGSVMSCLAAIGQGKQGKAIEFARDAIARNTDGNYDIKDDLDAMRSKGYNASLCDAVQSYFNKNVMDLAEKRDASWQEFKTVQSKTNHAEKLKGYKEVIRMESALPIPRYSVLGGAYADIGQLYNLSRKYQEAIPYHEKAIPYLEDFQDLTILCQAYTNAAVAYHQVSQYDKATDFLKKAIKLGVTYGIKEELAKAYATLGNVHADLKQYRRAQGYMQKAFELVTYSKNQQAIAVINNNMGSVMAETGDFNGSINYFKKAMSHFIKTKDEYSAAFVRSNVAEVMLRAGNSKEATILFEEADKGFEKLGENYQRGRIAKQLGSLYALQGKYDQAQSSYERALVHIGSSGDIELKASIYAGLGNCYFADGDYGKAVSYSDMAINAFNTLIKKSSEAVKRGLYDKQNDIYQLKTISTFRSKDYAGAFELKEKSRNQILREKLNASLVSHDQVASLIGNNAALIDYNLFYRPEYMSQSYFYPTVIKKGLIQGTEFTDQGIKDYAQNKLKERMQNLRADKSGMRSMGESSRSGISTKDPNIKLSNELEYIIELYRDFLKGGATDIKALRDEMSNILYNHLIRPIEPLIGDKKELYIIPDGILAFLPFETLMDDQGKYLCEKYTIRYVQSASILNQLNKRNYASSRKPLIAFANPVYENVDPIEASQYPRTDYTGLQNQFDFAMTRSASMRPTYISLGVTKWNPLPGTKVEAENIGKIVSGAEIHLGNEASEEYFKSINSSGKLKNYKVIHFATHGFAFAPIPGMSSVILSQYKTSHEEDGYLQLHEAESLDIQADLVTISACQTGLGRVFRGEGVMGLTSSFMIAGANGMAVSLWSVSDAGTAKFMSELYDRVYNQQQTFPEAFTTTKRDFIAGKYGEQFSHPSIWAPFVYYGK